MKNYWIKTVNNSNINSFASNRLRNKIISYSYDNIDKNLKPPLLIWDYIKLKNRSKRVEKKVRKILINRICKKSEKFKW